MVILFLGSIVCVTALLRLPIFTVGVCLIPTPLSVTVSLTLSVTPLFSAVTLVVTDLSLLLLSSL